MFRTFLSAVGIVELLTPGRLIDAAESIAMENPEDVELRSWVLPGARLEALVILTAAWRSEQSYESLKKGLGVIGLLALLFPRQYIEYGSRLAYDDADQCEWRPWVYTGTRVVGLLYVLVAVGTLLTSEA